MKKIINGKVYNTATAAQIGERAENITDSLDYVIETLYRKRTGEFFLHGEGGARSIYSTRIDENNWASGAAIMPLTYDAAQKWAEEHLTADEYAAAFGMPTEADDPAATESLRVYLPARAKRLLDLECQKTGKTLAQIVADLAETLA